MTTKPYYADDTVRQNLLHEFALSTLNPSCKRNITALSHSPEEHRDNILYLVRFVFQIANGYSYTEAIAHCNDDEMRALRNLIMNYPRGKTYDRTTVPHGVFLKGLDSDIIVSDIKTILYIVYNKWDFENDYLKIFALLLSRESKSKASKTQKTEFDRIERVLASHSIKVAVE